MKIEHSGYFEYFKSKVNEQWYFHLKSKNGKIICASEGYKSKRGCLLGIASVQRNAPLAEIK